MSRNCVDCGKPIPEKRLAAVPNAVRCTACVEASGDVETHRGEPLYKPAYISFKGRR